MTPTDEAKKLVAEALPCECLQGVYQWAPEVGKPEPPRFDHATDCPAYHRPAVKSLVTRLLADRDNWKLAQEVMRDGRDNLQIERDGLLADNERLTEALREIVKGVDDWNKAVSKVIQIEEPHVWPGLEHARALIEKASQP